MTPRTWREITRLAWMLPGLLLLCATSSQGQTDPAASFSGRWEADAPNGPWVFEFSVAGSAVTGRILQHGGTPGPGQIDSGKIEGGILTFKVKHPIVSPVARELTFTGRLMGGELLLERSIEIALAGPNEGTAAFDRGLFGTTGPSRITAKRIGPVPVPAITPVAADATRPVDVNGKWESLRWNLDVWGFDLKSTGNQLTGTVFMTAGPGRQPLVNPLPVPIYDAKIEGNTVSFKAKSHDNVRTISFTGRVQSDEIAFTRGVEVPPGAAMGFEAVYGVLAPLAFVAKRTPSIAPVPSAAMKDLQEAQKKWAARTFTQYEFVAQWRCFCPLPTIPLTYRANGTVGAVGLNPGIAGLLNLPDNALRPILERYATFDQIFAYLNAAAARQPHLLKIEFDATHGYPRSVTLHPGGTSTDDNLEFRITAFQVMN